ncbi:uncharacterized protein [Aristolochia californica]|uniref:uncharacterized protein n=1 Tax=Aristolochia californica TaxID=171875 RepID=UPI0035DD110A
MTVLRSREVIATPLTGKKRSETLKRSRRPAFEPSTPAKTLEPPVAIISSSSSPMDLNLTPPKSDPESETRGSDSGSVSNNGPRRRSLRLSSKSGTPPSGVAGILVEPSQRDDGSLKNVEHKSEVKNLAGGGGGENGGKSDSDSLEINEEGKTSRRRVGSISLSSDERPTGSVQELTSRKRVFDMRKDTKAEVEERPVSCSGKLRRKSERLAGAATDTLVLQVNSDRPSLNLRSGKVSVSKRVDAFDVRDAKTKDKVGEKCLPFIELDGDVLTGDCMDDVKNRQHEKEICRYVSSGTDQGIDLNQSFEIDWRTIEEEGKFLNNSKVFLDPMEQIVGFSSSFHKGKKDSRKEKDKGKFIADNLCSLDSDSDPIIDLSSSVHHKERYSKEKGKSKLVDEDLTHDEFIINRLIMQEEKKQVAAGVNGQNEVSSEYLLIGGSVQDNPQVEDGIVQKNRYAKARERFQGTARAHASRFAYFNPDEEGQGNAVPVDEGAPDVEDWPGPFSTAMKIIKNREAKLNSRQGRSSGDPNKLGPSIEWTPRHNFGHMHPKCSIPSLASKCLLALCEYVEQISSLEGVPEVLRSKLSQALCNSRKMDSRVLDLLLAGSPSEVSVKDCSSVTEEKLKEILGRCETTKLEVVQLDLSGRCMSDYLLRDTLASSPNNLPALISVSLKGACRLTDDGLKSLVNAAPLLASINLSQCSLLSSTAISIISDKLGSVLKKLYVDDCQGVDAMSCIPSLKRLKHLETFSVARVPNVCDKFVFELVSSCGLNIQELGLADCGNLTDTSLKVTAEKCPGLHAVDLSNLQKLTDSSLRYIANSCREIQVLRIRSNAFSDEACAAFLEASGGSLKELSLNSVKEVANHTAKAIASRCSSTLQILDLSFCRKLKDEALGLIVDACSSLRLLKLFGCTQVTRTFWDGHSNSLVSIIGGKASPILSHVELVKSMYA